MLNTQHNVFLTIMMNVVKFVFLHNLTLISDPSDQL